MSRREWGVLLALAVLAAAGVGILMGLTWFAGLLVQGCNQAVTERVKWVAEREHPIVWLLRCGLVFLKWLVGLFIWWV